MPPSVSIVMPFWNSEDTLSECLDSILAQTFEDWELVGVNDGSTDRSLEVMQSYVGKDKRMRLLDLPRVGIVEAPMRGIAMTTGRYLCRMDSDDVAMPDRIEKQLAFLESHPDIALCGTQVQHIGLEAGEGRLRYLEWINGLTKPGDITRELFVECPIPHPASMMRSEAFEAVGGYQDFGWAEDYDLIMRFAQAGYPMANVDKELLQWRHSEGRTSMTDERFSLSQFRKLKKHYLEKMYLETHETFHQWGAGAVGKTWLQLWDTHRPEAVVDIAPRKIGKTIHNTLVIEPDELPKPTEGFTVVAVGAPGARDEIRAWFEFRGYVECRDFLFLA